MNILYISALEGGKYSGPLYSVPKQVKSQGEFDNVYWVNLTPITTSNQFEENLYHYIPFKQFHICDLEKPFNKPDLIVFEEFFKIENCFVAREAEKNKIPYVIIPRCQMTKKYLQNKKLKKKIAGLLLFNHFARKAFAVQFLTKQEEIDSKEYYGGKLFVAPNGIDLSEDHVSHESKEEFVGTFIGRYSVWQKGLDLLIEAISSQKELLLNKKIHFELYGPDERTGNSSDIIKLVNEHNVEDLVHVNGPVFDNDKKSVLLHSDFFVHTSRFEGMPMSVLQALSYGLPCVVTQGSNLREEIESFDAGWGADDNVDSIASALKCMAENIDQLKAKGCNSLRLSNKYSWNNIARETHLFFQKEMDN